MLDIVARKVSTALLLAAHFSALKSGKCPWHGFHSTRYLRGNGVVVKQYLQGWCAKNTANVGVPHSAHVRDVGRDYPAPTGIQATLRRTHLKIDFQAQNLGCLCSLHKFGKYLVPYVVVLAIKLVSFDLPKQCQNMSL